MTDRTTTALQRITEALANGTPITLSATTTSDGNGITVTAEVATQPLVIPLPVPPVMPVPTPPPVVPVLPISAPAQFNKVTHSVAVPQTLKTAFPYATNAWWENIILGKERIAPDPYQIEIVDNGYLVCYPKQQFIQDSVGMQHITTQWLQNFSLEFAEIAGSWAVTNSDDLTVTLKWIASNGNSATTILAQGCPYVSMGYVNTTPLLTTQHLILSVNGFTTSGTYTGNRFKIVLNNGQTWIVYCSNSLSFLWSNGQLQASGPCTGILRLTVLDQPSDEAILDQYVATIPIGGTVTASYSTMSALYSFTWKTTGNGSLLMCAYPHHMDILQTPQLLSLKRQAIKGIMTGVVGTTWNLLEPLCPLTWRATKPITSSLTSSVLTQLKSDASFIATSTSDTYFAGKGLAKMARLLLIADELGDNASVTLIQNNLRTSLSTWFDRTDLFAYDSTWGGLVFAPALGDQGADFGYSYGYNDHHYHDGYFVYACATLAKFDPAWLSAYQEKITELVYDYCNPGTDTRYPKARNKDFFAGHSWAGGITSLADNRNQESTSEAINAYGAALLWGVVTHDIALQNYANLLLSMEIRSAKKYWHTYSGNTVYGSQWTAGSVGILWSCKIDDSTWFDAHLSCRRAIQVIPLTQFTELYVESAWVEALKTSGEMSKMLDENFTIWPTFVNGMLAVTDPTLALKNSTALTDTQIDDGASRTNLLWWIATR